MSKREDKGLTVDHTNRGFEIIRFIDLYGSNCTLQQSSVIRADNIARPGASAVWLGLDKSRMHLDQRVVKDLIAHLQNWLDTGSFEDDG